tara:strand:- start:741 stop:1781 length:1041 start_codon:yes stop_codon:yes gene_type:complete
MSEINDIRTIGDFRVSSFSKYKKTEVSKALLKSLVDGKKEESCYWSVEMICTGMFLDLWTIIIKYMSKYIYIANPQLPKYISKRIEDFKTILTNGYLDNELYLRNNEKIRNIFAEVIALLLSSKKKNQLNDVKISNEDFTVHKMSQKFLAKDTSLLESLYTKDDPKETFMAFNEFAYNINKSTSNSLLACYWIEWIIEYEAVCIKNKTKCVCERRVFPKVADKFQMSIVWIIWEIILTESKKRSVYFSNICNSLLDIFCLHYSNSNKKKYKGLIYYAIYLLCEPIDTKISFIHNKDLVNIIVKNIDKFYKQMKSVEQSPNTEYLFKDVKEKSSREKTIEKLELLYK